METPCEIIAPVEFVGSPPTPIVRPCDWGLRGAIGNLETQLGTIEAYNRLCMATREVRSRIDGGDVKAPNPIYANSIDGR